MDVSWLHLCIRVCSSPWCGDDSSNKNLTQRQPAASRACRRGGAERTLILSLPIFCIRLSQWGLPDNTGLLITVPRFRTMLDHAKAISYLITYWLLAYQKPVTSPVAAHQLWTPGNPLLCYNQQGAHHRLLSPGARPSGWHIKEKRLFVLTACVS